MSFASLPDRAVLAVTGPDARDFLQGLITNDIRKVTPEKAIFAALLSPQGKFLFDFFVLVHEEKLLLETDAARLPDLHKRLTMYRLRAKVELQAMPELKVAARWFSSPLDFPSASPRNPPPASLPTEPPPASGGTQGGAGVSPILLGTLPRPPASGKGFHAHAINYTDPRLPELGMRILYTTPLVDIKSDDYTTHRLTLGVPEGAKDLTADKSLLAEYGYDELHALDFAKGCYVGQEIVARTKHRATLRKFIYQVKGEGDLPPFGTGIMAGEREVGTMASSSGNIGLAHLRVEEVARAAKENTPLTCAGVTVTARLPDWCKTSFA